MKMEKKTRGQRGLSQATLNLIETCLKIIEPIQPISVRGVAYKLFAAGHIDSMDDAGKVSRVLTRAREQGHIPWDWIVDGTRQMEREPQWTNVAEYSEVIKRSYRRDFWAHQSRRVIVISEKSTVAGVVRPALDEYGVPFLAVHGFDSAGNVHVLADDTLNDDREHHFLYIGDYDTSGMCMSERDLPARLKRYGGVGFSFKRIALTQADTRTLPSYPAKKTDTRYAWYVRNYGNRGWELDAMDPNDLRDRVKEQIESFIDPAAWERHQLAEAAEIETVKIIAERMKKAVA
jgi:hypothetical protein